MPKGLLALLRLTPGGDYLNEHVASRGSDGRRRSSTWLCPALIEIRFIAPFDGIQRVVDGEVHHRHGPANKDGVLAALGRGLKSSDVPVKDLVGRARTRHSEAGQSQHSEDTHYLRESSGFLLHGKIPSLFGNALRRTRTA